MHSVNEAEFALLISDQFQEYGLGKHLLTILVAIGRDEGVDRIIGHILPENYAMLTNQERAHPLTYDFERAKHGWKLPEFERVYLGGGIQRLMQALGAYGVIGILREKQEFLRHIQPSYLNH